MYIYIYILVASPRAAASNLSPWEKRWNLIFQRVSVHRRGPESNLSLIRPIIYNLWFQKVTVYLQAWDVVFTDTKQAESQIPKCFGHHFGGLEVCWACCLAVLLVCLLALLAVLALGINLAAWDGFESHFWGPGDILGMGCIPDWPGNNIMSWIAFSPGLEHCFGTTQNPKIHSEWKVFCDFWALPSTDNCLIRWR